MTLLNIGDKAPDFHGTDQFGNSVSLSDYKNKKLILYFYPKANTPGCTAESCSLRDHNGLLAQRGYHIIGVSADKVAAQKKFSDTYDFGFPLIADENMNIIKAYGVWGEKKMYGKTYEGILRITFIINEEGIIENIIKKVETKKQAEQILKLNA